MVCLQLLALEGYLRVDVWEPSQFRSFALITIFCARRLVLDERKTRYLEDACHVVENQPVDQLNDR